MFQINYNLLYSGDIFSVDLKEQIALNRSLPANWCSRLFSNQPSYSFAGFEAACELLKKHIQSADEGQHEKFQIIVDSDLDGVSSSAILYKYLKRFLPDVPVVYTLHDGKQHGLSKDIKILDDVTLVILPDAGSNDTDRCDELFMNSVDVLVLDHHIIEEPNPHATIVNCMDGVYPNQNLCGAAVTWLFLCGFANCFYNTKEQLTYLNNMLDLVALATISDIMNITNEDNMYFIQNGLSNITSHALRAFLVANEISVNDCTIEHIRYKVSPFVSALIRMGSMDEKILMFRAFIDDYEEFPYEKRGSFDIETENIYDRLTRLCKNAKSRQDRAKQKMIDECQIYEYPHILLVEYPSDKPSTLTGLVANELANQYCKPCIVYHLDYTKTLEYTGSLRNYDGSPIESFKKLLDDSLGDGIIVSGHDNAAGVNFICGYNDIAEAVYEKLSQKEIENIGTKKFDVDFQIDAGDVGPGLIQKLSFFDNYSGKGFNQVTVLVTGIKVNNSNFKTMGKNSLCWKISNDGVDFVKFKVTKEDQLIQKLDDYDWDSEEDYGCLYDDFNTDYYIIDAICTFGINTYKGVSYPQAIVKDYQIVGKIQVDNEDDFDLDDLEV